MCVKTEATKLGLFAFSIIAGGGLLYSGIILSEVAIRWL